MLYKKTNLSQYKNFCKQNNFGISSTLSLSGALVVLVNKKS